MKKKSRIIAIMVTILIAVTVIGVSAWYIVNRVVEASQEEKSKENYVTRYEWMEMLCQRVGINSYKETSAYFEDVEEESPYFPYIQAAVEWEIIEKTEKFKGEEVASGEFIALTSMKAMGESKIQIQIESQNELTAEDYLELAMDNNLMDQEALLEGFSKEKCEEVLECFNDLYFGTFLRDDYSKVEYKEGVVELSADISFAHDEEYSEIILRESEFASLSAGTIVVLEQENTGLKMAKKITHVSADGKYILETVELSEVVDSLVVSDITPITVENIIDYYRLEENKEASSKMMSAVDTSVRAVSMSNGQIQSKGFKIGLSTEEVDELYMLTISVTDNNTGITYKLPYNQAVPVGDFYSAEIDIDSIIVSTQVDYNALTGVQYADVTAEAHAKVSGDIEISDAVKLPLCKTPAPLGNGFIGVNIEIYVIISADGSISLEAEVPIQASVQYEKGKGLRNFDCDVDVEKPVVKATGEMKCMIRLEPSLVILMCLDVMDVQIDFGSSATAEIIAHPTTQLCKDIEMSFPIITISVCGNDDRMTVIGLLGWSAEWEIVNAENAPIKEKYHHELLPNGTMQYVNECTYEENVNEQIQNSGEEVEILSNEIYLDNKYYTQYGNVNMVEAFSYCFAYPDNWTLKQEIVNGSYGQDSNSPIGEVATFTNERGVELHYVNLTPMEQIHLDSYYGDSRYYVNVTYVEDSSFVPYVDEWDEDDYYIPTYIIAKIELQKVAEDNGDSNGMKRGDVYYAVVPNEYQGIQKDVKNCGLYDGFTFMYFRYCYSDEQMFYDVYEQYPGFYAFFAKAPDGQFTEQEEKEIIAIMKSFCEDYSEEIADSEQDSNTEFEERQFVIANGQEVVSGVTEADLIAALEKQEFKYYVIEHAAGFMSNYMYATIDKEDITDFMIDNREVNETGTLQVYHCSCTVTKPNTVLSLKADIEYDNEIRDTPKVNVTAEILSFDIVGEWKGTYSGAPWPGEAVLTITDVDENGLVSGVYSYTPWDEEGWSGSYSVSGTMSLESLQINLTAVEWLHELSSPWQDFDKQDIKCVIYLDYGVVSGRTGGYSFTLTK